MSVKSLVLDPAFDKLTSEQKQMALSSVDPDFKNITSDKVDQVVNGIKASQPQQPTRSFMQGARDSDATQLIQQAAPSNLLKLAGVASANAPGVAGAVINSLPGMNPAQIMPSLQNVQRNPGQVKQALKRISMVQGGGALTPEEAKPALAGQMAGTALEMTAPNLTAPQVKPITPFTAGVSNPSTVFGGLDKANKELGVARTAARAIDEAGEASRFRTLLRLPAGQAKLAEEGKAAIEAGKDLSVTQLEGYGEAMGKMQSKGGVFANDYAQAVAKAREMLQWKAPELVDKIEKSAIQYAAKGDPSKLPWIIGAINPKVAALKLATLPAVQNAAGAAVGASQMIAPKVAPIVNTAINQNTEPSPEEMKPLVKEATSQQLKDFIKSVRKDNPDLTDEQTKSKVREMVKAQGLTIPKKK